MSSNCLILCHPLLPPSIFLSIKVFSNESALHIRWPKYWSFSFSISPFNEYSGLIFFRIDWFDLLLVQGTLKSLLQYHSSKASILQCLAFFTVQLSSVQFSSVAQLCPTLCDSMNRSTPGLPVRHQLLEFAQTHVHRVGDAIQPSHLVAFLSPPALLFCSIRVFSIESALHIRWPKYWCFSFSISPSNEYSGLIFFRIDWFDLRAVQGTLKSLLQHHSSKASILQCSPFFIVQFSHPYMTTGKTIALTR